MNALKIATVFYAYVLVDAQRIVLKPIKVIKIEHQKMMLNGILCNALMIP
jgi:hypothetical protein